MKKQATLKKGWKKRRGKIIAIIGIIILLVGILIFIGLKKGIFSVSVISEEAEELSYLYYKQICSQDRLYFEGISILANKGKVDENWIRAYKLKSSYCKTTEMKNLTKDEFEDLNIECECLEREMLTCSEGWELKSGWCIKGDSFTSVLKACSFYSCQDNRFVEAIWPRKRKIDNIQPIQNAE